MRAVGPVKQRDRGFGAGELLAGLASTQLAVEDFLAWPHVATWAETEIVLAADLGSGTDDPRATAAGLLRRALAGRHTTRRPGS